VFTFGNSHKNDHSQLTLSSFLHFIWVYFRCAWFAPKSVKLLLDALRTRVSRWYKN
jgi:hypothetical protein